MGMVCFIIKLPDSSPKFIFMPVLTKSESGWKFFKMLEELEKLKKIAAEFSAAPSSKDNLFLWDASLYGPEGSMWSGGLYKLELVFDDTEAPPRVRFLNEMWHPHSKSTNDYLFVFYDSNSSNQRRAPFPSLAIGNKRSSHTSFTSCAKVVTK
jgi:hypothetical protein